MVYDVNGNVLVQIDDTLSVEGAAADAKATGDGINSNGIYDESENLLDTSALASGVLNTSGGVSANASFYTTDFIPVNGVETLMFQAESSNIPTTSDALYWFQYDSQKTKIGSRNTLSILRGGKKR